MASPQHYRISGNIHTKIRPEEKQKLLEFGKGSIKKGIEYLLTIADQKEIVIRLEVPVSC